MSLETKTPNSSPEAHSVPEQNIGAVSFEESAPVFSGLRRAILAGRIAWKQETLTKIEDNDSSYRTSAYLQTRKTGDFFTPEEVDQDPSLIYKVHNLMTRKNPDMPVTTRERIVEGRRLTQKEKLVKNRSNMNRLKAGYKGYGDIFEDREALDRLLSSRIPRRSKREIRRAVREYDRHKSGLFGSRVGGAQRRLEKLEKAASGQTKPARRRSEKYHKIDQQVSTMSARLEELRQIEKNVQAAQTENQQETKDNKRGKKMNRNGVEKDLEQFRKWRKENDFGPGKDVVARPQQTWSPTSITEESTRSENPRGPATKSRMSDLSLLGNGDLERNDAWRKKPEEVASKDFKPTHRWKNEDYDIDVVVEGSAGERDGEHYVWVVDEDGNKTGIPEKDLKSIQD